MSMSWIMPEGHVSCSYALLRTSMSGRILEEHLMSTWGSNHGGFMLF